MFNAFYERERDKENPPNPFGPKYSLGVTQAPSLPEDNYSLTPPAENPVTMPESNAPAAQAEQMPKWDSRDRFYQDMERQMMERSGRGMQQAGQNMVTGQDIAQNKDLSDFNNFAAAMSGAADKVGNFEGKMAQNDVQGFSDRLNKSNQDNLANRSQAYQTANQDILGGLQGVQGLEDAGMKRDQYARTQMQAEKENDPMSPQNVSAREILSKFMKRPIPENMTLKDMGQFVPLVKEQMENERSKYKVDSESAMQRERAVATANAVPKDPSQKPLGEEGLKRLDSINMGTKAIEDMSKALGAGENTFSLKGDNNFTMARTRFTEALGRMQSGGAISADEEKRFASMAPSFLDPPEIKQKKLLEMRNEFAKRLQNLKSRGTMIEDSQAPVEGGGGRKAFGHGSELP